MGNLGWWVVPGRGIWGCFPRMEDLELFVLGVGNWGGWVHNLQTTELCLTGYILGLVYTRSSMVRGVKSLLFADARGCHSFLMTSPRI